MTFNYVDYWSQPKVGELAIFDFGLGADNKPYSWITWNTGDNRHFYQEDYHDNKWQATWVMDYFGPKGVTETADIYPKRSYQFWTRYRTTAFVRGKEILWGSLQNIGDEFNAPIQIDAIASTKFEAPTPGNQRVKFCNRYSTFKTADGKKNYKDVVEIEYDQTFGDKTSGWRAWHARGIGITQINWRWKGNDVGSPFVANIVTKKGKIVNKYPVIG
jgi:hypothetical protein